MLRKYDESEKRMAQEKVSPDELPEEMLVMNKSLRSIEVVGQIVKNRQGSLPKTKIKQLVREMYGTAFRTISYFGALYDGHHMISKIESGFLIKDVATIV